MKLKNKKIIFLLAASLCFLSGCKDIQIFEKEVDPNKQLELSDDEIETDKYYIKNGTKFVEVYQPKGNIKGSMNALKKDRVFYFVESFGDENKVPEHYRGEIIAYASNKSSLEEINLERFKDLGYSIGIYEGRIENDGYYHVNLENQGKVENSELFLAMAETQSTDIRIKSINGVPVSEEMIDKNTGVFLGLSPMESYKIEFFSGTYYYEAEVKADTHFLQSYEIYSFGESNFTDTLNGYMAFETPENLKSGWYFVNGNGLFKYYNFIKGEKNIKEVEMNENYYTSEEEMIAACSSEYFFEVKEKSSNLEVKIREDNLYSYKDITAYIYSPDKTRYGMIYDEEEKALKTTIKEAMAGKWKINVIPKNVVMNNIEVNALETVSELTLVEQTLSFDQAEDNLRFCIDYEGEGTVNGTIITPSGETFVMEEEDTIQSNNGIYYTKLIYDFIYVEPGNYAVRIYHHPTETKIGTPYTEKAGGNSKDVIIITN